MDVFPIAKQTHRYPFIWLIFAWRFFYSDYCLWTMCFKNCRTGRYCSVCVTDIMASVWIADQRIMNIKYQLIFNMNIFVRHEYFDGWLIDREAWLFVIYTHTQIDPNRRGKKKFIIQRVNCLWNMNADVFSSKWLQSDSITWWVWKCLTGGWDSFEIYNGNNAFQETKWMVLFSFHINVVFT